MANQGKGFGFLFEMGCGKTLTAIAVAGAGYQMGKVKRVLIVAPTSVCAVWPKEFQEYAAFPYVSAILVQNGYQFVLAVQTVSIDFQTHVLEYGLCNTGRRS